MFCFRKKRGEIPLDRSWKLWNTKAWAVASSPMKRLAGAIHSKNKSLIRRRCFGFCRFFLLKKLVFSKRPKTKRKTWPFLWIIGQRDKMVRDIHCTTRTMTIYVFSYSQDSSQAIISSSIHHSFSFWHSLTKRQKKRFDALIVQPIGRELLSPL